MLPPAPVATTHVVQLFPQRRVEWSYSAARLTNR
jgi:hypothetical protein